MSEGIQKWKYLETGLVFASDLVAIILSYLIALSLRYGLTKNVYSNEIHLLVGLVSILIYIFLFFLTEQKKDILTRGYAGEILFVCRQNAVLLIAIAVFVFLFRLSEDFSRLVYGYFFIGNIVVSYFLRLLAKHILRAYACIGRNKIKTMIISDGAEWDSIQAKFKTDAMRDYQVVAIGHLGEGTIQEEYNSSGILIINGDYLSSCPRFSQSYRWNEKSRIIWRLYRTELSLLSD